MKASDKGITEKMHELMRVTTSTTFSEAEVKAMITGLETVVDQCWNSDEDGMFMEGILGLTEDELGALFTKLNKLK